MATHRTRAGHLDLRLLRRHPLDHLAGSMSFTECLALVASSRELSTALAHVIRKSLQPSSCPRSSSGNVSGLLAGLRKLTASLICDNNIAQIRPQLPCSLQPSLVIISICISSMLPKFKLTSIVAFPGFCSRLNTNSVLKLLACTIANESSFEASTPWQSSFALPAPIAWTM